MERFKPVVNQILASKPIRRTALVAVFSAAVLLMSTAVYGIEYQNIFTDYSKTYSHFAPAGKHSDTESYKYNASLGYQGNIDRRHANCNDCHDPHSATRSPSPLGSYFGAGTQANVSGVKPLYWNKDGTLRSTAVMPAGTAPQFAFVSAVIKEYELCFKCHSSYSFDFAGYKATYGRDLTFDWTTRSYVPNQWTPDPAHINVTETDLAMEFNPNNASFHPVVDHGKTDGNFVLQWAEGRRFNETFAAGFSADSRVKCTDCHASDSTTVKGPHGSNNKYILKRRAPTEEPTITRVGYSLGNWNGFTGGPPTATTKAIGNYNMTWYVRTDDVICYNCHDIKFFGPGKGHPSRGKHWNNCQWHRPIAMDEVGCATCKVTPIHGSATARYMMLSKAQGWTTPNDASRYNAGVTNWCFNCHDFVPGQPGGFIGGSHPSCPRFYSVDASNVVHEETRVHFQSSVVKAGAEYFIPLPTPDMENIKGLGNIPAYRYYNREDDYILFKQGTPETSGKYYKVRFDQPSTGDRPDGQPVAEVGYEDSVKLFTLDHAKDTQVYLSVDGNAIATKDVVTARRVTDNLGNDITDVVGRRTANADDRAGWFTGHVGYGNTIDEIYAAGNWFVMDFGDLSRAPTIKLLWGVNEEKGAKLPVLIQTKDSRSRWVTRGSARHAEDRYGYLDIKPFFPAGTKDYQIRVIPTLNSVDFMAVSVKDSPVKKTVLALQRADYTKAATGEKSDMTAALAARDKNYATFDYLDAADLFFDIPAQDKTLGRRDFVFAPVGYYETGGDIPATAVLDTMTAEKAQDFATLTPAGGYANHYNVNLLDPGVWNEQWQGRTKSL